MRLLMKIQKKNSLDSLAGPMMIDKCDDAAAAAAEASSSSLFSFPQFAIDPDNISVLYSPAEFHQWLIDAYKSAQYRIVLAALYIGTATPEREVIRAIEDSCHRALTRGITKDGKEKSSSLSSSPIDGFHSDSSGRESASTRSSENHPFDHHQLTVNILIDSARGRREENDESSLSVLAPLFNLKNQSETKYLFDDNPLDINIHLFHSPLLSGILYHVLPQRVNEILGVFHTKIFLIDDAVILTGANLSGSYLTNRQDRYIVLQHVPILTDFLHSLIKLLQKFSFSASTSSQLTCKFLPDEFGTKIESDGSQIIKLKNGKFLKLVLNKDTPNPICKPHEFKNLLGRSLRKFLIQNSSTAWQKISPSTTSLHVAIQAGFCSPPVQQEHDLLSKLLMSQGSDRAESCPDHVSECSKQASPFRNSSSHVSFNTPKDDDDRYYNSKSSQHDMCPNPLLDKSIDKIVLASGYLNMTDEFLELLTKKTQQIDRFSQLEVFMASPEANSFHQSQGMSKYIPMAYSYVGAAQLLRLKELWTLEKQQQLTHKDSRRSPHQDMSTWEKPPVFWEYDRLSWTFHSKGIWLYPGRQKGGLKELPIATIVGSSNFGLRSRHRDLDVSFFIQTRDSRVREQFHKEVEFMRLHSREVTDVGILITRCPRWLQLLLNWAGLKSLL